MMSTSTGYATGAAGARIQLPADCAGARQHLGPAVQVRGGHRGHPAWLRVSNSPVQPVHRSPATRTLSATWQPLWLARVRGSLRTIAICARVPAATFCIAILCCFCLAVLCPNKDLTAASLPAPPRRPAAARYRHFEIDDLLAILSTKGYPDSHSKLRTFIKLGLFGHVLAEWRKVVFIDSDMLPVENIDALFDVPHKLAMVSKRSRQLSPPPGERERERRQHPTRCPPCTALQPCPDLGNCISPFLFFFYFFFLYFFFVSFICFFLYSLFLFWRTCSGFGSFQGEEGDYEFNSGIMVIETPALDTFAAIKREMAAMPR